MTRGSQQRPWVLAEVVSTHRHRHSGMLWFRAINSSSIHSSFFPSQLLLLSLWKFSHCFCLSPSLCLSIWHAHFFKLTLPSKPMLSLSSKAQRGGIEWLSENFKVAGATVNDKTSDRNQNSMTCFCLNVTEKIKLIVHVYFGYINK